MIYLDWGKYQQKPRQWGPLSEVQRAVRHNAAQLGIDPASIAGYWPMFDGREIMSGRPPTAVGGSPQLTQDGISFSNGDYFEYGFGFGDLTGALSFFWKGNLSTATTNYETIISKGFGSNYPIDVWVSNAGLMHFYRYTTNHVSVARISNVPHNTPITLAGVHSGQIGSSGLGYLNGVDSTSASTAISSAVTDSGNSLRIGRRGDGATQFVGDQNTLLLIRGVLSASQVAQLHETPYALLMPVSRPFIFDLAGGGGATETPGNASIGITGLDPIIDITEIPNIDALTIAGQDVTEVASFSEIPENASIVVTGLDVNTLISITESPGEAAMSIAGQDVNTAVLITEQVLNAALTLVGNDIILAESVIVNGATITINGRQVTVTGDEVINIIRQSGLSIGIRIGI